jgi:type III restriction enzyme
MELILQKDLPHQQAAVDAVSRVFEGVHISNPKQYFENPHISLTDFTIERNIRELQKSVRGNYDYIPPEDDILSLDVKMETGTGKTYVYTKVIYELHRRYGINKFIIAVPSLAIKAGTAAFMQDSYARRHFRDVCSYGTDIELGVLEAVKNKKKGRSFFPNVVSDFIRGSCQNTGKIYVLLVNMQLLTGNSKMLKSDDYDFGVEGYYRPFDALKATKPFVIIDEPHRFSRAQSAYRAISEELKPQCIIRFGATFPEISVGLSDYRNLVYDLNACDSFNLGLIKGVAKEHFEPLSKYDEVIKITSIVRKESVNFQYISKGEPIKTYTLRTDDSLSIISSAFEGVTIDTISNSSVLFSNGIEKHRGEKLVVDIYMTSYQEQMLKLALHRHFETEKANFNRNYKIKTLALFFIDDISSYRADNNGKEPYLLKAFERLLKEQLEKTIDGLNEHELEYRAYLEASLSNLSACHAGYFAQDNSNSDEEIAKEVDIILRGKKQLVSFKNEDGSYNTLRFLFSKWTLKEGWDNPNVFTIAKLRSSGSEISKLQEVGRGLRLPVDENGNRIANEEFQLNYIVDFTDANFAEQLVEQINGEVPQTLMLTDEKLAEVATKLGKDANALFFELGGKGYVDMNKRIISDKKEAFFAEYPDFATGLHSGKVRDRNKEKPQAVKIRKAVYSELRELWERINQRYLLFYDKDLTENIEDAILDILRTGDIFTDVSISSSRQAIKAKDGLLQTVTEGGVQYIIEKAVKYNEFLKRISSQTNIPITSLHSALCKYSAECGSPDSRFFNENTIASFCSAFTTWKNENHQKRFRYVQSKVTLGATALTYADGTPREDIAQGRIGTRLVSGSVSKKYLYDAIAYDSPLEKENIEAEVDEIVVYGKIPRRSIAIPTITGGTYSPDFMYVVKRKDGTKDLNVVIETKDVEGKSDLRGVEAVRIECAEVFFDMLSHDGYKVHFCKQLNNKQMAQIIKEIVNKSE